MRHNEIFGRIFTQLAAAELGLKNISKAYGCINKAIEIFRKDISLHSKATNITNIDYSEALDIAKKLFQEYKYLK
jgi:hypothetical protein